MSGRGDISAGMELAGRASFPVSSFRLEYHMNRRGKIIEYLDGGFALFYSSSDMTADGNTRNKVFANLSQVSI